MRSQGEEPSKLEEIIGRVEKSVGRVEERRGTQRGDDFAAIHGRVRQQRAAERLRDDDSDDAEVDDQREGGSRADQ